jgi:phenylacetaldehyde dehydrogenase
MATAKKYVLDQYSMLDSTRSFVSGKHQMVIGGKRCNAASGATLDVFDPASATVIATVPAGDKADIDQAVGAARHALEQGEWSKFKPVQREKLLLKLADLLEANAVELAQIDSLDNGKSAMMAQMVDLGMAIDFTRYMAGWATKIEGSTINASMPGFPDAHWVAYTRKEPVGVVGAIVPWNFPLLMAVWKVVPALTAGCTVVLKPAEETPLSALRLAQLLEEAGCPAGVLNVVTGYGHTAGAALSSHPGINKVAFTGSTEVGKLIGKAAVDNLTRMSLELGGKSPVIVLEDADIEMATQGAIMGIFFNQGEVCTAGSRLYAHKSVFDKIVAGVAAAAEGMQLGPGLDPASQMGPLVSKVQQERVQGYIASGIADGVKVVAGGGSYEGSGYFVKPTVLTNVRPDMKCVQEEIFGPVLAAAPFDDIEEVVRLANNTPYGLAASIWSNNLSAVNRLIPRIKAGTVWVNCHNVLDPALPFGGYKQSGVGREMGKDQVEMYLETKSVLMAV